MWAEPHVSCCRSLFGWQFQALPVRPSTTDQIGDRTGGAITNMQPGKRGTHAYFEVDDREKCRRLTAPYRGPLVALVGAPPQGVAL